jgi:tetratricopeptide (TPR) repeat protein
MDLQTTEALLARAGRRRDSGDVAGARADLDRAVALDPASARLRLVRALLLISLDESTAAKPDAQRAVELGAGAAALAVRGWLALHLDGEPQAAERDLTEALDGGDRQMSTYVARGWARNALGDHAGALADAIRAGELAPAEADARFLAALSRIHLGDPDGIADLDRAELLYTAVGDQRGRRDVWDVRAAIRQGRRPVPAGPGPWLWFGPRPEPGAGSGRVILLPGGQLALAVAMAVIRYLVTVAVIAALTALLPGLSVGSPAALTLLVVALLYRLLRTGLASVQDPLPVLMPRALVCWLQQGPSTAVGAVRWLSAGLLSTVAFAVAAWVTGWFGLGCQVDGPWPALVVGAVLGLGTFVAAPVLRRAS